MNIFQMSYTAAFLIVIIVIIRALAIHSLPKKTFLILWSVALCRLLIPYSIPSKFSVYTIMNHLSGFLSDAQGAKAINTNIGDINTVLHLPVVVPIETTLSHLSPWLIIWLLGFIASSLFFGVTHILYRREYRSSLPIENEFINKWLKEHSIKRTIRIRQLDRINSPMTYGIWNPIILFPKTTDWTNEVQLQYILTHELIHIKRFDTLLKWILCFTLSIHWFNPFVWVMYILANRDIELSCDESVVWSFGESMKSTYALTIISLEEKKRGFFTLANGFSKKSIEERISAIMNMRKISSLGIVLSLVLVIGLTTVFATSKASSNNTEYPINNNVQTYGNVSNELEGDMSDNAVIGSLEIENKVVEPANVITADSENIKVSPKNVFNYINEISVSFEIPDYDISELREEANGERDNENIFIDDEILKQQKMGSDIFQKTAEYFNINFQETVDLYIEGSMEIEEKDN